MLKNLRRKFAACPIKGQKMNEALGQLLQGGFIFAIVCAVVIALTLFDTPKEKRWSVLGKNRLVGLVIIVTGAIGVGVVKGCLSSPTWVTELYTTLITGFTAAVAAIYINKGYSVGTSEITPED